MPVPFARKPFGFFLVTFVIGICVIYYLHISIWLPISLFICGIVAIVGSYCLSDKRLYGLRWLFGAGIMLLFTSLGMFATMATISDNKHYDGDSNMFHKAAIIDIPHHKNHSDAYEIYLLKSHRKVIAYLQPSTILVPGTVIQFKGAIRQFTNTSPSSNFNYPRYMTNHGYSGWCYLKTSNYILTKDKYKSIIVFAHEMRYCLLTHLSKLNLSDDEYGVAAALLWGYKGALSANLRTDFQTTGTVHVLSVSGLHIGIIYGVIVFIFSLINLPFLKRYRFVLVIFLLWIYAFLSGLSPSVVRAVIMFSLFCLSRLLRRKSSALHTLFIAAFFILLINPLALFDVSFQLSFISVFFILNYYNACVLIFRFKNVLVRTLWQMFVISCVAQLGVLPLCLFYFGMFPIYFFLANLIIVPLITLLIYLLIVSSVALYFHLSFLTIVVHSFFRVLFFVVQFFVSMPYTTVSVDISSLQMLGLFAVILFVFRVVTLRYRKSSIVS